MSRSKSTAHSLAQGEIRSTQGLPVVNPHAAGADIGAEFIYVCIPGPDQTQIVRSFGTYTAGLHTLADWLVENGIQTIAMESTGIYWIPLFEVLEARDIHCCLISGNLARRLPARHKTDVLDCQWIQTLHSLGLLTESFRPDADYHIIRVALDQSRVEPRFVHWTIKSSVDVEEYLDENIRGATRQGVNSKIVVSLPCRIPSLSEQRHIVAYLDGLQAQVDELVALQAATQAELDALLPSVLDRAFQGEL